MENEKHPLDDLKNDEITKKREKWEMHTEGPGIWREIFLIFLKLADCWNKISSELQPNWDRKFMMSYKGASLWKIYKQENWKSRKMRNTYFRTWNMARKTEKVV